MSKNCRKTYQARRDLMGFPTKKTNGTILRFSMFRQTDKYVGVFLQSCLQM